MYILIDYYTGKQVTDQKFNTESEAELARNIYLDYNMKNNVIHNNLILIKKT